MNAQSLNERMFNMLQEQNFEALKGSRLSVHLPIQEELLNFTLAELIATSEGMKDFEEIVFSDLNDDEFVVSIKHKKLDKTIRCLIHHITYNKLSEPLLNIEFLEGIRFYEKIALKSATTFKKGWSWFKSQFTDSSEENKPSPPAVDISSSSVTINFANLLRQQGLGYLVPLVNWEKISTQENKLIIDLSLKK